MNTLCLETWAAVTTVVVAQQLKTTRRCAMSHKTPKTHKTWFIFIKLPSPLSLFLLIQSRLRRMLQTLIHFLLIFPSFLAPVPLLLPLTLPPLLPHQTTAPPTTPPGLLVSLSLLLSLFILLLFTPTWYYPLCLSSTAMLALLPAILLSPALFNSPVLSLSSPLVSVPISVSLAVRSVSMSAVCLCLVSEAEPKAGSAKGGPCLTSLALSKALPEAKLMPEGYLTDFFGLGNLA